MDYARLVLLKQPSIDRHNPQGSRDQASNHFCTNLLERNLLSIIHTLIYLSRKIYLAE